MTAIGPRCGVCPGRDVPSTSRHSYFRLILGTIGITDETVITAGGAKVVDMGEQIMNGFIARLEPDIERAAMA